MKTVFNRWLVSSEKNEREKKKLPFLPKGRQTSTRAASFLSHTHSFFLLHSCGMIKSKDSSTICCLFFFSNSNMRKREKWGHRAQIINREEGGAERQKKKTSSFFSSLFFSRGRFLQLSLPLLLM